jgi:hypothetical protein
MRAGSTPRIASVLRELRREDRTFSEDERQALLAVVPIVARHRPSSVGPRTMRVLASVAGGPRRGRVAAPDAPAELEAALFDRDALPAVAAAPQLLIVEKLLDPAQGLCIGTSLAQRQRALEFHCERWS